MAESNNGSKLLPPYVTFVSLMNFLNGLKRGIPGQIDRSLMKTMSGLMQAQMMSALKYLDLIDANGHVKDTLTRLVNSEGPERSRILSELLTASYPFLFNGFDLAKATSSQFRQKFTEVGASGDSVRKCIAFFLSAAKEAGVEVSPYIAETVRPQTENRQRKPATRSSTRNERSLNQDQGTGEQSIRGTSSLSWEQMLLSKFPSFDPAWPDEVKKEWFTAFHQMMKMGKSAESHLSDHDEAVNDEDEE